MGIGSNILTESKGLVEARLVVDSYDVELNDEGARVTAWYEVPMKDDARLDEFLDELESSKKSITGVVDNVLADLVDVWVEVEGVKRGDVEAEADKYGPTIMYQSRTGLRLELWGTLYVKRWKPDAHKKEGLKADVEVELGSRYGTKPTVTWER